MDNPMSFHLRTRYLAALLACGTAVAVCAETGSVPPHAILDDLTAANEARTQRLREEAEWTREKERIELLRVTIEREARRAGDAAAAAQEQITSLQDGARARQEQRQRIHDVRALLARLTLRIHDELATIDRTCPPGVIPRSERGAAETAEDRFLAATDVLARARHQATRAGVEIVSGTLDGDVTTVRLLRLGGVAAWWRSLDAKRAGRAARVAGKLQLRQAVSEEDAAAIHRAFDMVAGRRAPDWVVLSVDGGAGQ